jgi:SAM-dependent methyltransferase
MERDTTIADLFERLDRERQLADRQYNDALTALDRALQTAVELPAPSRLHDSTQLERLNTAWKITPDPDGLSSRSLKGRLRALIWRAVAPTIEAQQRFNAAMVDHVNRNIAAHEQAAHVAASMVDAARHELQTLWRFQSLLLQFLQTITAYVDTKDRSGGGPELREQLGLVRQRLAMVERETARAMERRRASGGTADAAPASGGSEATAAAAPAPFAELESVKYLGFEDRFRGTESTIRERLAPYVPLFENADNVVDVGCGRGELLDLLRDRGVAARGIDANQAMVDECRARGLHVEQADAVTFLSGQMDGSLGGLVAIQVAEHFEPAYLLRFLDLAYQKLRPGAPLVIETINPACWMAFFECYIRDLTHARPLHPDTLRYLVQATGFTSVNVEYRQPVTESDRLDRVNLSPASDPSVAAIANAVNAHADKLNARMFSSMDYAVVARR